MNERPTRAFHLQVLYSSHTHCRSCYLFHFLTQGFHLPLLVLVGDPQQLPSIVISQLAGSKGYGRSLFERLYTAGVPTHMVRGLFNVMRKLLLYLTAFTTFVSTHLDC